MRRLVTSSFQVALAIAFGLVALGRPSVSRADELDSVGHAKPAKQTQSETHTIPDWEGRAVIRLNGGVSFPVGNFGDAFNTGYGFGGSIGYGLSHAVLISAGMAYHDFKFSRDNDVNWSITPFTLNADYRIPSHGPVAPWLGGGIGLYRVRSEVRIGGPGGVIADEDFNNFGLNFGGGIGAPLGKKMIFGTGAKFHWVAGDEGIIDTPFMTLQVGVGWIL
jgi:opacity protein-like surface antigen